MGRHRVGGGGGRRCDAVLEVRSGPAQPGAGPAVGAAHQVLQAGGKHGPPRVGDRGVTALAVAPARAPGTSRESPRLLTAGMIAASDLAVTQGCGETCPYVPGARYRDWPLDDPKGQDEATVCRIVAGIDTRVRDLLVELVPDIDLPPSLLGRA